MAGSSDDQIMGLIRRAMAWRVKYRVYHKEGGKDVPSRRISLLNLGVHPGNRAGVYPNDQTVMGLCQYLVEKGYTQEEADHAGVCVQDVPVQERPAGYISIGRFNQDMSRKTKYLAECFTGDISSILFGTLSHSHLLLVLLAWLHAAQWSLDRLCDRAGRLDVSAVADSAAEMVESIKAGLKMEVLSYKLVLEEPDACSAISQALNSGHEQALRTTEMTALSCLNGEVGRQFARLKSTEEVEFATVCNAMRVQLDTFVDEPEFVELFDFVINLGATKQTFISGLIEFASAYVNQKKRRLRLSSFSEVNQMPPDRPRSKVAVIKRAFRKQPVHCYCPTPETRWKTFTSASLRDLEELLHYFHEEQKHIVALLPESQRILFLANVDVTAADAMFVTETNRALSKADKQTALLQTTLKYFTTLSQVAMPGDALVSTHEWIKFGEQLKAAEPEKKKTKMTVAVAAPAPKLLEFNEKQGTLLNFQDVKLLTAPSTLDMVPLPWKEWMQHCQTSADARDADIGAAMTVLRMLQLKAVHGGDKLDIVRDGSQIKVIAKDDIEPNAIRIAPGVLKMTRILKKSEHPFRVSISIHTETDDHMARLDEGIAAVAAKDDASASGAAVAASRIPEAPRVYYLNPEWKEVPLMPGDIFVFNGDESMHPFWAVRRIVDKVPNAPSSRIGAEEANCAIDEQDFTNVSVGTVAGKSSAMTITVGVPMLSNRMPLKKGDELIVRPIGSQPKTTRGIKAITWKTNVEAVKRVAKKEVNKSHTKTGAGSHAEASTSKTVEI